MAHRHQARDRPGTAVPPVHDGGIELMPAFRGEYGTTPCVEVRRIFEHGHRRFHRIQGATAGREDRMADIERASDDVRVKSRNRDHWDRAFEIMTAEL